MAYRFFVYVSFFIFFMVFNACRTEKPMSDIQLSSTNKVVILDSLSAAQAIVKDDVEYFFKDITPIDMMIQMKRTYPAGVLRDSIVDDYKKYIQADVLDFTKEEVALMNKVMAEAFELCQKLPFSYFPKEIKLIKTHGKHYGEDTYFTRENSIVIPKQALKITGDDVLLKVMLHEISHIITRFNPTLKARLYETIGFEKLDFPLVINDSLRLRLLTNPDGHELTWAMTLLQPNGENVKAIPLIFANETQFKDNKKEFFEYLNFNYFEIKFSPNGSFFNIQTVGNQQKSTLNIDGINKLLHQKLNTYYIIHPDEIIADNFSILLYSLKNPKSLEAYTEGGRDLLDNLQNVLTQ